MAKTQLTGALNGANAINGLTQNFLNSMTPNVSQKGTDVSFADTLSQTGNTQPNKESIKEPAMTKTVVEKQPNNNIKNDAGAGKDVKSLDEGQVKDVADKVVDKAEKVFDKIEEVLDVSEDELNEAMEVLALSMTDLFDNTNLQQLVMEVTGTEDTVSLITDVDLYDQMKEITSFANEMLTELSEETGIDETALLDFIENDEAFADVLANAAKPEVTVETEVDSAPIVTADVVKEIPDEPVTDEQVSRLLSDNDETARPEEISVKTSEVKTDKEPYDLNETTNVNSQIVEADNAAVKTETVKIEINGQKADNGKHNDRMSQNENAAFAQTPTTQAVNTTVEAIANTIESYTSEQAQEIFRQVTEFVKVNITAESQSMEMQLHPASLGTVNMQINSTNGQITAHLTVQNELVKAVLESQLIQLQQTFNEQGTKVEAIEVTVANYNLDSGMNNNTDNNENEGNRGTNTARRRNINLNADSAFDDFTDEEKLAKEVMDMNGNSVDFTA